MWNILLNPFFVFTFIWALVAFLIKLKITLNIGELEGSTWRIIWVNFIFGLYFLMFFYSVEKNKLKFSVPDLTIQLALAEKWARRLLLAWIFLVVIDVIYSGGFPLIWIFTESNSDYTNLGIPSLRGIQHTLYLFVFTIYALCINNYKVKNLKFIIFILTLYPVLMMSRSLMMYALLQVFCSILFWTKIKFSQVVSSVFVFIFVVLIFGLLGDTRGPNSNPFSYLISPAYMDLMEELPSGFTWVYVYLTANFNNIIITHGTYDLSYSFGDIFYNLVPGFLKGFLFESKESVLITDANLNVASFFAGYITSFGEIGAILGGLFLQLIAMKFYFLARSGNVGYLIGYSILFSCLVISVFFDALMTVSTVAQVALAIFLAKNINIKIING